MATHMSRNTALTALALFMLSVNLSGCNSAQSMPVFVPAKMISSAVDDSMLASRVRTALMASDDIADLDIRIQTKRDEVVLSGYAGDSAQLDRNIALVRQVKGVRKVINHISIRQFT